MDIGIEQLNFYTPNYYVDLVELAEARDIDPDKFTIGIGQERMSINPISQDTISMAANAALPLLSEKDKNEIDLVILATESGLDFSKAGATTIKNLLGIQPFCRAIEIKQACYSATAGVMMAKDYLKQHPDRKALVIASDIARYGLATSGEVTQGAGAVAVLMSSQPKLLKMHDDSVFYTEDIYDFWRPYYLDTALVDGQFSNEAYISFFNKIWTEYQKRETLTLEDFKALCFHLPYSKMGKKALKTILEEGSANKQKELTTHYDESTVYTKNMGNIYTGSLFLGLISLLDHQTNLKAGDRLGFFSYGSGAVGEFFSGSLVEGFDNQIRTKENNNLLEKRVKLTISDYESMFTEQVPTDGETYQFKENTPIGHFYLAGTDNHRRHYELKEKN